MAEQEPAKEKPVEPEETAAPETGQIHPAEEALEDVLEAADAVDAAAGPEGESLDLPSFSVRDAENGNVAGMSLLDDVDLSVQIELGRTRMYVEDVLRLNTDSVIELDKAAGDPVDIYVNDRHIARGEVLVLNENFCVRVSEIIRPHASED